MQQNLRLNYLDAVRAFALLLGIVFHASLSFSPLFIGWAVMDVSTSNAVLVFMTISHSFRMPLFFLIAGFFSHMTFHSKGFKTFMSSRFVRIALPFMIAWFLLRPLIVSGWIMGGMSLRGEVDILAGLKGGFQMFETLPSGIFTGSHLWFLYYLTLVTTMIVLVRQLIHLSPSIYRRLSKACDHSVNWVSKSSFGLFILSMPMTVFIWNMKEWGLDTPDKSLVPHWPTLLAYGSMFAFGWLLNRNASRMTSFAKITLPKLLLAGISVVGTLVLSEFQFQHSHPQYHLLHFAYVLSYALMMWSLVSISIGVFEKICQKPNKAIRYIADSSYWLYLVHLPVVVWLQVMFAELPGNWILKLAGISILTIGISLFLYDLLVRSSFIGRILNGKKQERVLF